MKRLVLIVLALVFAAPVLATDYTVTTSADAALVKGLARENAKVCAFYGLAAGCTQKAAREVFCKRAGVGGVTTCDNSKPPVCTTTPLVSTCDGSTQVDIYADTAAYAKALFRQKVDEVKAANKAAAAAKIEAAKSGTRAQRDAVCASIGEQPGCLD